MKEEHTITQFGRVPTQRLSWSAILGGTLFGLGVVMILSLFGVAVAATAGVKTWLGVWSLVTMFIGFAGGGWLAARTSESQAKSDGRLHGLVVWALGSLTLLYLALSTAGMAGILGSITGHTLSLAAGPVLWTLGAGICGLIGGVVGGHVGGYTEAAATATIRRAA